MSAVREPRVAVDLITGQAYVEPNASTEQIVELANAIALVAEAIAAGTVVGPVHAAVRRLASNVALLQAWVPDDRS